MPTATAHNRSIVYVGDANVHARFLARDVIYTSRAYAMMPVSVCPHYS